MTEFQNVMSSKKVDTIVRIAVIVSIFVSGFAAWQGQTLASCTARYNDINNQRTVALTQVTETERRAEQLADVAQAELFTSPILNKPSATRTKAEQDRILELFVAYQRALNEQTAARAESDQTRREPPIPDPPKDVCG